MIKNIIHKLFNSAIVRNLSILISGTVIAQLVVVGFQILIRRIYSPEDFGAFAVYMSVLGISATFVSLRYEQTIILPKEQKKSLTLLKLSVGISFVISLLLFFVVLFLNEPLGQLLGLSKNYLHWLLFLPLSIFLFSLYQSINFFLIREKQFSLSGSNKVVRRLSEGTTQLLFGYFGKSIGLFIGDMIGQLVMTIRAIVKNRKIFFSKITLSDIEAVAVRYKDFPLKNGVPSVLNSISLLLPIILINRYFSEEITGYFDLARMVLIIPLSLVTASLSQVILQRFTERRNNKQSIKKDALGIFAALLSIAGLFILVIEFFGPSLFEFVFGQEWRVSGIYAKILVWAFAFKFVISPFNISFTAFEKIGVGSIWQSVYFILILLLIFINHDNILVFLKFYLTIELVAYTLAAIMNFTILNNYEKRLKQ